MRPIIESLRDYILTYPKLPDAPVQVDYLGSEAAAYTVEPMPGDPVYRKYADGGCLKQYPFLIASREHFSADVELCIQNQAFYEELERWLREQGKAGILPDLGEGRRAVRLDILTGSYAFSEDTDTARYQIQLRLIYEEV